MLIPVIGITFAFAEICIRTGKTDKKLIESGTSIVKGERKKIFRYDFYDYFHFI